METNSNHIDCIFEETKEGLPTIAVLDNNRKIYLHSRFYPTKEAEKYRHRFNPDKYDSLIVLGTGLGYHLIELQKFVTKYKKIILIERLSEIETEIATNNTTIFLTRHQHIITFITGRTISEVLNTISNEIDFDTIKGLNIIEHAPSMRTFSDYYQKIREGIEGIIAKKSSNKATKTALGNLYMRNILLNMVNMLDYIPVLSFSNKFTEFPSIVITTGPSLDNYIEDIRSIQQKVFIIAVDSALPVLRQQGIKPDLCISIDPLHYISEHFLNSDRSYIPVFSISSNHTLFEKHTGLVSLNSHPLAQVIEELFPDTIGSIDSATGSVAGDAIKLALFLGFNSIGLLGFDFSFPYYNIYARGTSYQIRYALYYQTRFHTAETSNFNYIMKSSRGYRHAGVFSRRSFITYKLSIEEMLQTYTAQNIVNIHSSGIPISSLQTMTMREFIQSHCKNIIEKHTLINSIMDQSTPLSNHISLDIIKGVLSEKSILQKIINASGLPPLNDIRLNRIRTLVSSITS